MYRSLGGFQSRSGSFGEKNPVYFQAVDPENKAEYANYKDPFLKPLIFYFSGKLL